MNPDLDSPTSREVAPVLTAPLPGANPEASRISETVYLDLLMAYIESRMELLEPLSRAVVESPFAEQSGADDVAADEMARLRELLEVIRTCPNPMADPRVLALQEPVLHFLSSKGVCFSANRAEASPS